MFVIPLILCSIGAMLFVLVPYYRSRAEVNEVAPDIAVYKSQLSELSIEFERGLIGAEEEKRTRTEIERRLLKAAEQNETALTYAAPNNLLAIALVIIIMSSGALYAIIGTPSMPDFPKALEELSRMSALQNEEIQKNKDLIRQVKEKLSKDPNDARGWAYIANLEMGIGNFQAAAEALYTAHNIEPDTFDYQLMYAESLIMASGERVTPAAMIILNKALKMQPDHPGPKYYIALSDFQAGDIETAHADWKAVRGNLEEDNPLTPLVDFWINKAAVELGLVGVLPETKAPSVSNEQAEAIQGMDAGQQQEFIRQMVAQLADKQVNNPTNIEGWMRLSRAYLVLEQKDDAIAAMQSAVDNAPEGQKAALQKEVEKLTKLE